MTPNTKNILLAAVACLSFTACMTSRQTTDNTIVYKTENITGFPTDEDGYFLGVSACYAGRIGDCIVMAGGCNFPVPGKKRYYKGIYAARPEGHRLNWRLVGYLPEAAAYGVTVENGDSLVLAGGCNTGHSLSTVLSLHLDTTRWEATVRRLSFILRIPTLHGRQHRRNTVRQQYLYRRRHTRREILDRRMGCQSLRHPAMDQNSIPTRYAKGTTCLRE